MALLLAVTTRSIWALVLAESAAQLVRAGLAFAMVRLAGIPQRSPKEFKQLLRFAGASVSGSMLWSLSFALPVLFLQRHTASASVGVFSFAYTYAQLGALLLGGVAARIVLPTLGGVPSEQRLGVAWKYAETLSLALAPFTGLFVVAAPQTLVALAGSKWTEATVPLTILAWGMAARVSFPINALAVAGNRIGLDNALAAVSLVSLSAAEHFVGLSTPIRTAQVVAITDVALIFIAMMVSSMLWGPARRAYATTAALWAAAVCSVAFASLVSDSEGSLTTVVWRGAIFLAVYLIAVCIPRRTRVRYASEVQAMLDLVRKRRTS